MLRRGSITVSVAAPTANVVSVPISSGWTGASPVNGDLLVAYVISDTATDTLGVPAGWQSIPQVVTSTEIVSRMVWVTASGLPASVDFPVTGTSPAKVQVVAYNPEGATLTGTGTPEIVAVLNNTVMVTPTEEGVAGLSVRVAFFAHDSFANATTPPATGTLIEINNANSCTIAGYDWIDDGTGVKQDQITWSILDSGSAAIFIAQFQAGASGAPYYYRVVANRR